MTDTKTCRKCGETKSIQEFHRSPVNADGRNTECKTCVAKRAALEYQARIRTAAGRTQSLFNGARCRARDRGLEFTLTREWIAAAIEEGVCQVTGIPFDFSCRSFCPSLDRTDASGGYTPENVKVTCWLYNRAKGVGGHQDVMRMVHALVS